MSGLERFPIPAALETPLHTAYEAGGYLYKHPRYVRGRHYGLDIGAKSGARIVSMFGGKLCEFDQGPSLGIQIAEYHKLDGRWIIWKHNHASWVTAADEVATGATIAKVGTTGQTFGAHDHIERYAVPVGRFKGPPRTWGSAARFECFNDYHTNPRGPLREVQLAELRNR